MSEKRISVEAVRKLRRSLPSLQGWDRAIADAQLKIAELQCSIDVLTDFKRRGEPWPPVKRKT